LVPPNLMDSSDVQQALPTNGLGDVEILGSNPVEPGDRPEHEEQFRSAQPEAPVLDDHPASQSPVPEKHKPSTSPTKHLTPAVHTAKGASGPPTPQVKRVLFFNFRHGPSLTLFLTRTPRIADFKLGQVWRRRRQGCSTSYLQAHAPSSLFYLEACTSVQPHCAEEIHLCTVFESNHATQTVNRHPFRSGPDT
jgi:hypothetical protein